MGDRGPARSVCVFCGSQTGASALYAEAARALASALARHGLRLVYGGGSVGLMGVLAEAALAAGVHVTGVVPRRLLEREVVHRGLPALHVVDSMHARKARMAELSDAFIALPGGFGTLDELFEAITWTQLGYHRKPCGLLEVNGFFARLAAYLDHAVAERFIAPEHRALLVMEADPERLLERLGQVRPSGGGGRIGRYGV